MFIYCIKDEVFVQWEFGENFIEPSFQKTYREKSLPHKIISKLYPKVKNLKKKMKRGSLTF